MLAVGIAVETAGFGSVEGAADKGLARVGDERFRIADGEGPQPFTVRAGALLVVERERDDGERPAAGGGSPSCPARA